MILDKGCFHMLIGCFSITRWTITWWTYIHGNCNGQQKLRRDSSAVWFCSLAHWCVVPNPHVKDSTAECGILRGSTFQKLTTGRKIGSSSQIPMLELGVEPCDKLALSPPFSLIHIRFWWHCLAISQVTWPNCTYSNSRKCNCCPCEVAEVLRILVQQ
jgi:hypothetical protein